MSSVLTELGGGAVGESGVVAGDLLPVAGLLAALRDVHSTEAQPGGLLVKLVHLARLSLQCKHLEHVRENILDEMWKCELTSCSSLMRSCLSCRNCELSSSIFWPSSARRTLTRSSSSRRSRARWLSAAMRDLLW